jgi:glutamine amidotransferase
VIAVIDYGAGNLRSVANALDVSASAYRIVNDPEGLKKTSKIILPGVGHFGQMVRALDRLGLRRSLRERLQNGALFLGICLGFQALFEGSEEAPGAKGLALLPGTAKRFPLGTRVPHMGWNRIVRAADATARLLCGIGEEPFVYFAHSYYLPVIPAASASCSYEVPFTAAVEAGGLLGVQFHPEKSGPVGLRIIRNFAEL